MRRRQDVTSYVSTESAPMLRSHPRRRLLLLSRSQHSSHDRSVQFVLPFADVAGIVFHADDEHRQIAFLVEIFVSHRDRKNSIQPMLTISSLVAMLPSVPGKHAQLIEVIRQAVMWIGKDAYILPHFFLHAFVRVVYFVQFEERDDALALGILRDVERSVHVDHPGQHPAYASLAVAHQPPVFERWAGRRIGAGLGVVDRR